MIYARVIVKLYGLPQQTHNFTNIVKVDVSFYDNIFWSRPGYADFNLTFAYNPITQATNSNDPVNKFSKWWQGLNKNQMPRIEVEFHDGISPEPIAKGYLLNWEESREDFEVEFTCVDELKDILDEPISRSAFTKYSDSIEAVQQPTDPGNPPGDDDLPPIFPPGTPTISYMNTLNEFFWQAINEWWNLIRGSAPALIKPATAPAPFNPMSFSLIYVGGAINQKLQSLSSRSFRVQMKFKQLSNLERKEVLSDLSKFLQSKIVCKNGIRFIEGTSPVNITGFIQSVNSNSEKADISPDRILDTVMLQRWDKTYNSKGQHTGYAWKDYQNFTQNIKTARDG